MNDKAISWFNNVDLNYSQKKDLKRFVVEVDSILDKEISKKEKLDKIEYKLTIFKSNFYKHHETDAEKLMREISEREYY